jgi:hypothetical protein
MFEPTQILLSIVIITLTILLVIIGWQVYKILFEIYKLLSKLNSMVDGAVSISNNLTRSFKDMSGFTQGLKTVVSFLKIFKKEKKENTGEKKDE